MSHANSGSDPPPPASEAQDARGAPFFDGHPYSGSPPPNPKLSVGVPGAGLLRARPGATGALAGGGGFSSAGGRGQGAGARGRRPSGDAETGKPVPLQRGGGNQGARPGSRGFLLTAWKSPRALRPRGHYSLGPAPSLPSRWGWGLWPLSGQALGARELSTAVRDCNPSEGCAHQKPVASPG